MSRAAYRLIGEGLAAADQWLARIVQQSIGCSEREAYSIVAYYAKKKLATADHIGRRYHAKHDALFEPAAFRRALELDSQ